MNKKKNIIFLLILFLSIGGTLAYFTSTSTLENEFKSGKYKTVSTDSFISPSDWAPGDTTPKTLITKNEGTLPVRVRVKIEEEWVSENGDNLPLVVDITQGMNDYPIYEDVAIVNYVNNNDWVFYEDYFYYVGNLLPGDSTSSLIDGVTYNPKIPSDMECTSTNGVYNCVSTGDGYDGATYTLNVIVETVQSDAVLSAWNLTTDPGIERYVYRANGLRIPNFSDITNYSTVDNYLDTNSNVFVRHTVLADIITKTDIGFILNGNVYYLNGGGTTYNSEGGYFNTDSIYYDENKDTLISAFGINNCSESIIAYEGGYKSETHCSNSDLSTSVDNNGYVTVENTSLFSCFVLEDGSSSCDQTIS